MTTSGVIDTRVGRLFDMMDTDGDGYVEWPDYQRTIDRLLERYHLDRGKGEGLAIQVAYQTWWLEIQRHSDGAQRLGKDEYVAATRAAVADSSRANVVDGLSHAIFDVLDTDDDGKIDRQEFSQLLQARGLTHPDAIGVFDELDTDKDGHISREEYLRSWREFFTSDDAAGAGSRYCGPLG